MYNLNQKFSQKKNVYPYPNRGKKKPGFSMEKTPSSWYDQGCFSSRTAQRLACLLETHLHKRQKNLFQFGTWRTPQVFFQIPSLRPFSMMKMLKMTMKHLRWLTCYQNLMWFLTQAKDELEPDRCLLQPLDPGFGILPKKSIKIVNTAVVQT